MENNLFLDFGYKLNDLMNSDLIGKTIQCDNSDIFLLNVKIDWLIFKLVAIVKMLFRIILECEVIV